MSDEPEMLLVGEVARRLRLSTRTVYRLVKEGTLPSVKIGHSLRIPAKELDRRMVVLHGEANDG